ncbi:hypothetical protein ACM66B_002810 [Microbotryomycetes sp. NB124-2]
MTITTVPGPASTPQIHHAPPLFQPEHLFPLLRPNVSRPSRSTHSSGLATPSTAARRPSLQPLHFDQAVIEQRPSLDDAASRQEDVKQSHVVNEEMYHWGVALVTASALCFVLGFWSMAVGPFVKPQGVWLLDVTSRDTHYKYLFILLVPVTLYAVIINWWGLKIFRHA